MIRNFSIKKAFLFKLLISCFFISLSNQNSYAMEETNSKCVNCKKIFKDICEYLEHKKKCLNEEPNEEYNEEYNDAREMICKKQEIERKNLRNKITNDLFNKTRENLIKSQEEKKQLIKEFTEKLQKPLLIYENLSKLQILQKKIKQLFNKYYVVIKNLEKLSDNKKFKLDDCCEHLMKYYKLHIKNQYYISQKEDKLIIDRLGVNTNYIFDKEDLDADDRLLLDGYVKKHSDIETLISGILEFKNIFSEILKLVNSPTECIEKLGFISPDDKVCNVKLKKEEMEIMFIFAVIRVADNCFDLMLKRNERTIIYNRMKEYIKLNFSQCSHEFSNHCKDIKDSNSLIGIFEKLWELYSFDNDSDNEELIGTNKFEVSWFVKNNESNKYRAERSLLKNIKDLCMNIDRNLILIIDTFKYIEKMLNKVCTRSNQLQLNEKFKLFETSIKNILINIDDLNSTTANPNFKNKDITNEFEKVNNEFKSLKDLKVDSILSYKEIPISANDIENIYNKYLQFIQNISKLVTEINKKIYINCGFMQVEE